MFKWIKGYKGFSEGVGVSGIVEIRLFDKNGKLKKYRKVKNRVPTVGLNHIADQLSSSPGEGAMSHMAVGTGTNAAAAGDTTLQTELDRNTLSSRTDSGAVVTYVASWAAGDGTGAITEAGIFNAASAGTLLARQVFTAINKGASDTLQITWTITFAYAA
jgi:hypothetical protein